MWRRAQKNEQGLQGTLNGIAGGKPVCASLPEGTPSVPSDPSGWGKILFDGAADCEAGYLAATWDLFGQVYQDAEVTDSAAPANEGLSSATLEALEKSGFAKSYASNAWIGRLGP